MFKWERWLIKIKSQLLKFLVLDLLSLNRSFHDDFRPFHFILYPITCNHLRSSFNLPRSVVYSYADACRIILNIITTRGHSSLEKYTSHFIERVVCERWVEDWTELQHIDPHSYGHNSVSFPFSWVAQPGASGPSLSGTCTSSQHLLYKWSELQLLNLVFCGPSLLGAWFSLPHLISNWSDFLSSPGLYNCLTPTFFLWASQIALIQLVHGRDLIAWPGSICYMFGLIIIGFKLDKLLEYLLFVF